MCHKFPHLAGLVCSQQAKAQVPARAVGCFKLNAGHAMSLTPNVPGELRISHGRVWVTFGQGADDSSVHAGDYFLEAGDLLRLLPGQQLVMEAYDKNACQHVYFNWEPDTALSRVASSRHAQHVRAQVRQPLRDLGLALQLAGHALSRLVQALFAAVASGFGVQRHREPSASPSCLTIRN